jgi:N-terminal half of MaoC dehydratase
MRLDGIVGREFGPVEFVVGERLSVLNFARALEVRDPMLLSAASARAQGYRGRPVPPVMFLFFLVIPGEILEGELGFTWGKTLAASTEFDFGRIVTEEDRVTGRSWIDEAYERTGRDGKMRQFLRLRTEFSDESNALVCRSRMLFIERLD